MHGHRVEHVMNFNTEGKTSEAKIANIANGEVLHKCNASNFAQTKDSVGEGIVEELFIPLELFCRMHVNLSCSQVLHHPGAGGRVAETEFEPDLQIVVNSQVVLLKMNLPVH